MIVLLVMTDGRDEMLEQTRVSAENQLTGPISRVVVHDDTGKPSHRAWLRGWWPDAEVIGGDKVGFGRSIARAWHYLADAPESHVFHLEDDFLFNRRIDLAELVRVLDSWPHLVQLALRRQPWNQAERDSGGIIEQHPGDYVEREWRGYRWLEHTRFFTTNPSLYRRSLCDRPWPEGDQSEGRFGIELRRDHPDVRFAFWGSRGSGEWVRHIGTERAGTGY